MKKPQYAEQDIESDKKLKRIVVTVLILVLVYVIINFVVFLVIQHRAATKFQELQSQPPK